MTVDKIGDSTMITKDLKDSLIGFIGLGQMGSPMALNLLRAGYALLCYDLLPERMTPCIDAGAQAAAELQQVAAEADIILLSLPNSDVLVDVAERDLLQRARPGQTFIDTGTTTVPDTCSLSCLFADKGAVWLDAPVSGGGLGAQRGDLFIWVGGDHRAAKRCWPLFEAMGLPNRITYMGESGFGQVAKGVNQLVLGLEYAIYLEALAFGVRAGLAPEQLWDGFQNRFVGRFKQVLTDINEGGEERFSIYYPELPYFLKEAAARGFSLPISKALYDFCRDGEPIIQTNRHGLIPSLWRALMEAEG